MCFSYNLIRSFLASTKLGNMKILSLNVRGLGRREEKCKVKKLVCNQEVDMLLIQESKLKELKFNVLQSIWGNSDHDSVHVDAEGSAIIQAYY